MVDGPLTGAPLNFPEPPGAPYRPMFPVFTGGVQPRLAYQVEDMATDQLFTILGVNLESLEAVSFFDVNANTNVGTEPTVVGTVVTFGSIELTINGGGTVLDDAWGLILVDERGNQYTPVSPFHIFS